MAIRKIRPKVKKVDGSYDTIHFETEKSMITDFPDAIKNPYSLTIQANDESVVYDGSSSKKIEVPGENSNLLDNSNFKIWQRGTSSGIIAAGLYTCDRWRNGSGQKSFEQTSIGAKEVGVGVAEAQLFHQVIEHNAGTFDFTFQMKLKTSGPFYLVLYPDNDASKEMKSSLFQANSNLQIVFATFKNVVISDEKMKLGVAIKSGYTSATSLTAEVEWAKLEHGLIATPYIAKHPSIEIAACHRYFIGGIRINAIKTSSSFYTTSYRFHMRTLPTYTLKKFSPFGSADITNMSGCSLNISSISGNYGTGNGFNINYATLPTCTSYSVGALLVDLSADF